MRKETLGGLDCCVTGGTDREGGGGGPVVVLLHGFGAPGDDLVPLWRTLDVPREIRFVFPAAPLELAPAGPTGLAGSRAWWRIDVERLERALREGRERDLSREVPDGLAAARDLATALLDDVERTLGVTGDRLVLGGFSQGAMLATDVLLRTSRPVAGLAILSGTLIAEDEWRPLLPARSGLRVLQSHGRRDPLLPFRVAERLRDLLVEAGLEVRFVPFHGMHEIPGSVLDDLGAFLRSVLAAGG